MKLPYPVLNDLQDAERNFDQLTIHGITDGTALGGDLTGKLPNPTFSAAGLAKMLRPANNLSDVANAATTRTNLGFAAGSATLIGNGTTETNLLTVTHGLGRVPIVVVGSTAGGAFGNPIVFRPDQSTLTTTQFGCRAESNAAFAFNVLAYWIAIG